MGDSCLSILGALASRTIASAGVIVRATASEAMTARAYESTRGWKNEPDRPFMRNTGSRATTSMRVA